MFHVHSFWASYCEETATEKFVGYYDQLVIISAQGTVYRDSSVVPFEEFYEAYNEIGQQFLQYSEH